jgi:hypothetical protein
MDPTTVLHKVVHGDSIENARPTKRVNRISSCMPQPSIYVTSIEPRKLPHRSWGPVSVVDPVWSSEPRRRMSA